MSPREFLDLLGEIIPPSLKNGGKKFLWNGHLLPAGDLAMHQGVGNTRHLSVCECAQPVRPDQCAEGHSSLFGGASNLSIL